MGMRITTYIRARVAAVGIEATGTRPIPSSYRMTWSRSVVGACGERTTKPGHDRHVYMPSQPMLRAVQRPQHPS